MSDSLCTVHGILQTRILEWDLSLLQGIFPTQGTNPGLLHCRQILYQLSYKGRPGFSFWFGKIPWRREWLPIPVFLPEKAHGQRNLVGYSPWGRKESDTTEQLTLVCSLMCYFSIICLVMLSACFERSNIAFLAYTRLA